MDVRYFRRYFWRCYFFPRKYEMITEAQVIITRWVAWGALVLSLVGVLT